MLKFLTLTGADETVQPGQLASLSRVFPFVEWGILFSETRFGTPRFPSKDWLYRLADENESANMNLSLHLCGRYVRSLIKGHAVFLGDLEAINRDVDIWKMFKRVQLNLGKEETTWHVEALVAFIQTNPDNEFILQLAGNDKNEAMAKSLVLEYKLMNVSFLFDASGGAGIFDGVWKAPKPMFVNPSFGYAGGLGPDNIGKELHAIYDVVKKAESWQGNYWVDMETKIRGGHGGVDFFDLDKVRAVIESTAPWFPNYAGASVKVINETPSHIASPIKPQPWLGDNRIAGFPVVDAINMVAEFHRLFDHPILDRPEIPDAKRCELRYNITHEELEEFRQAIEEKDIVGVADALADLMYVVAGAVHEFGLSKKFKAIMDEVHRSNMSKACKTEEEAEATLNKYVDATGEKHHAVKRGEYWFVYRTRDMKTVKSVNYSPADLFGILHEEAPQPQV